MKKQICLWSFLAVTVIAVALRTSELFALIEPENGFIIPDSYVLAAVLTAILGLLIAACSVFISMSTKGGSKGKGFYFSTTLSALALGVMTAGQPTLNFSGVPGLLKILCIITSVLCSAYLVAFSLRCAVHFPLPSVLTVMPPLFFVIKAACVTIKSAYLTIISDTLFEIAAYCFIMLFFLEFARQASGVKSKISIRKFAAFGSAAAALSFTFSVPKMLFFLFSQDSRGLSSNDFMLFFAGLYIACEVFSRLLFVQQENERVSVYYAGKH